MHSSLAHWQQTHLHRACGGEQASRAASPAAEVIHLLLRLASQLACQPRTPLLFPLPPHPPHTSHLHLHLLLSTCLSPVCWRLLITHLSHTHFPAHSTALLTLGHTHVALRGARCRRVPHPSHPVRHTVLPSPSLPFPSLPFLPSFLPSFPSPTLSFLKRAWSSWQLAGARQGCACFPRAPTMCVRLLSC